MESYTSWSCNCPECSCGQLVWVPYLWTGKKFLGMPSSGLAEIGPVWMGSLGRPRHTWVWWPNPSFPPGCPLGVCQMALGSEELVERVGWLTVCHLRLPWGSHCVPPGGGGRGDSPCGEKDKSSSIALLFCYGDRYDLLSTGVMAVLLKSVGFIQAWQRRLVQTSSSLSGSSSVVVSSEGVGWVVALAPSISATVSLPGRCPSLNH